MSNISNDCGCNKGKPQPQPKTMISRIMDKVFVSESVKNDRLDICKGCEHYITVVSQCGICGCFLEAKTRLIGFHCALDQIGESPKW